MFEFQKRALFLLTVIAHRIAVAGARRAARAARASRAVVDGLYVPIVRVVPVLVIHPIERHTTPPVLVVVLWPIPDVAWLRRNISGRVPDRIVTPQAFVVMAAVVTDKVPAVSADITSTAMVRRVIPM